ncbi:MAG: TolC family outer membrane protein [Kistimonas sp.]|nr:TolC family outer membrane protein [Kistimonas sp.]
MTLKKMLATAAMAMAACSHQALGDSDLLQVYNMARDSDAQLLAAQAAFKASAEAVPQSRSGLLPRIEASASYSANSQSPLASNPGHAGERDWRQRGWGLTLSQSLFDLSAWLELSGASSMTEQARLRLVAEQQQLILRSAVVYFDVLRARDNLSVTEAQQKTAERELKRARQRFEAGLVAETDVHDARASYHSAQVARLQAKNQLTVAQEAVRLLTGRSPGRLIGLDKSMPVKVSSPLDADKWAQHALTHNLELQAAGKDVEAARTTVKASYAKHAPVLTASAAYNRSSESPASEANLSGTTYSLQLSLPLFSGGGTQSRVREAGYRLKESEANLDHQRREVGTNARTLFHTVETDIQRIAARCQGIVSAHSALRATQGGYDIGTRNVLDLLDAQQRLYSAQRDYLNARYDFIINVLQLKRVSGSLSPNDLKELNVWIKGNSGSDFPPACQ